MTNEEALNILVTMRCTEWFSFQKSEALDCAIVALQQSEIIRCRDCKHFTSCKTTEYCGYDARKTSSSDFCSFAERKEE